MNIEKLNKVFQHYLNLLDLRNKRLCNKPTYQGNKQARKGYESKKRIIAFFVQNGEWPSIRSTYKNDKILGNRLENFVCPRSASYDSILRRIVMSTGRKSNNKRQHNPALFKEQILEFMRVNGHAPRKYREQKLFNEGNLKAKLDYYTLTNKDMTFLGKVYDLDPCHRSGIPMRFRPVINEQLDIDKPLIRMVKDE